MNGQTPPSQRADDGQETADVISQNQDFGSSLVVGLFVKAGHWLSLVNLL